MLKFEVESLDEVDESMRENYQPYGEKYRLKVDGIDDASELKEALRKEREERAAAKSKLSEYEQQQAEAERKRMEERQEYESLYKQETESKTKLQQELEELRTNIAQEKRTSSAAEITASLTRDTAREKLLRKEAMQFIHHTPEGIKINGPDGQAWDAKQLSEHLRNEYPFLVDGNGSSGGGAPGGNKGGGAAGKKFNEMTGAELSTLRQQDPSEYQRLRDEYHRR